MQRYSPISEDTPNMREDSAQGKFYWTEDVDGEIQRLRLRCEALAILLYGPVPERTRDHVQRELEACESAVTALRAELAAMP